MRFVAYINQLIDDNLHQRIRVAAAQQGVKIQQFIVAALTAAVERHEDDETKRRQGR